MWRKGRAAAEASVCRAGRRGCKRGTGRPLRGKAGRALGSSPPQPWLLPSAWPPWLVLVPRLSAFVCVFEFFVSYLELYDKREALGLPPTHTHTHIFTHPPCALFLAPARKKMVVIFVLLACPRRLLSVFSDRQAEAWYSLSPHLKLRQASLWCPLEEKQQA